MVQARNTISNRMSSLGTRLENENLTFIVLCVENHIPYTRRSFQLKNLLNCESADRVRGLQNRRFPQTQLLDLIHRG